jgi:nitrogen fixation-related uncharacterized protein
MRFKFFEWCDCIPVVWYRYTGILFGITNASSSFAGTLSTYSTGQILYATDNWAFVFIVISAVYCATGGLYLAWASSENQFDDLPLASDGNSNGSFGAIPKGPWR